MKDIVQKLEFGCPFKLGTIGEKDAERAEQWMEEGAKEITRLRAVNKGLTDALKLVLEELLDQEAMPIPSGVYRKAQAAYFNATGEYAEAYVAKAKGQGGE